MSTVKIGDKIPEFKTVDQNEKDVSRQDFLGSKSVLYFYPKDDTPTCTNQACNLRDNYEQLIQAGYKVFGISPDKAAKHQKFIKKYALPFDLLVDEDHAIANAFGVWGEKTTFGKTYMGIKRTTFVMDEEGVVTEIIAKVKAKEHTEQILG
ncbi:MAG: thioredoxin-dependent thiol peroxidase [Bacteroidetes bacterium]|jgi:thioredoxin-dependent peroxiredoxin|nr:thioredoxin-dependent thiol peroxidase [Bacteroidota bacterium]